MQRILIVIASLLSLFLLVGCNQNKLDYTYLMSHPAMLEKEYNRCKGNDFDSAACHVVQRAASDFTDLVNQRMQNAAAFGKLVLVAEMKLAEATSAITQSSAAHGESSVVAEQVYQLQQDKVDVLFAVIAATSAE